MTYSAVLRQLLVVHLILQFIEAGGDVFKFHPSSNGYVLQGLFEVPVDNFVGNQFWLCFDYETASVRPKRSFGRYLRSVAQNDAEEDEAPEVQDDSTPKDYPEIECGGSIGSDSNHWFALNGVWIEERKLHIQFVNVDSKKVKPLTLGWTSDDPNEKPIAKMSWKLGVNSWGSSPSVVNFMNNANFQIPSMKKNSQMQIRLNGFGVRLDALISNHLTMILPIVLPPNVQPFDPSLLE